MLYLWNESMGEIILSDDLSEDYFEEISIVQDGALKKKEELQFTEMTTEKLLCLKLFLGYEGKNPMDATHYTTSINEALEEFANGRNLYATGCYYSKNIRSRLGHSSWKGPIHFMSGKDPNFIEKDAQVLGFIRNENKLEVVLKCKCESFSGGNGYTITPDPEIHKFTVVQAHF